MNLSFWSIWWIFHFLSGLLQSSFDHWPFQILEKSGHMTGWFQNRERARTNERWMNRSIYMSVCVYTHTHTHTHTHTQSFEPAWIAQIVANEIVDFLCEETFAGLCSRGSQPLRPFEEWWQMCSLPGYFHLWKTCGWMLGLFTVDLLF